MSKEYASPLVANLKLSKQQLYFYLLTHLLALTAIDYAQLDLLITVVCLSLIALSFIFSIKQMQRYMQFTWLDNNQWILRNKSNELQDAQLTPMSFFINHLVVLVLRLDDGRKVSLIITKDTVNQEVFRRLKVKLTMIKPSYFSPAEESEF